MPMLDVLTIPVVAAPMAGGPSTPALAAAVSDAGGLGFLAAGYLTPEALAAQVVDTRARTGRPFGVNVFVPEVSAEGGPRADVAAYREALLPLAGRFGVELPEPRADDDHWEAKVDLLVRDPVAVVSFTFGLPPKEVVSRLHDAGSDVWLTVASVPDAVAAAALGVDALVVQGTEAGGHRATLHCADTPNELGTVDLVRCVAAVTDVDLVAAGGIMDAAGVRSALDAGARAVQCGTAFLLASEAGTSAIHREALRWSSGERGASERVETTPPRWSSNERGTSERVETTPPRRSSSERGTSERVETTVTRAFTGRPARALANAWTRDHPDAPAAYPEVHQVTRPIRVAAAKTGDADHVHLWAGAGWRAASEGGAAEVARSLVAT